MRPIAIQRSKFRYPLDVILGSEAHVRLLRTFVLETDSPLGISDAARLTGLTPAGARKALERLVESGVIKRIGSGRTVQYALHRKHALVTSLAPLFEHEQQHCDSVIASLRIALNDLPEINAAWIERLPMDSAEPVKIDVVVESTAMPWIDEELRSRLSGLERDFDLIIETSLLTRADEPSPGPDAVFLRSLNTGSKRKGQQHPSSHDEMDLRSLRMAKQIADLIRSDPSLIPRARRHMDRLLKEDQGTASDDIAEWRQLLQTYSPERVMQLLVSQSSRAVRLRQSSPFFAVLTAEERDRLLTSMEKHP